MFFLLSAASFVLSHPPCFVYFSQPKQNKEPDEDVLIRLSAIVSSSYMPLLQLTGNQNTATQAATWCNRVFVFRHISYRK